MMKYDEENDLKKSSWPSWKTLLTYGTTSLIFTTLVWLKREPLLNIAQNPSDALQNAWEYARDNPSLTGPIVSAAVSSSIYAGAGFWADSKKRDIEHDNKQQYELRQDTDSFYKNGLQAYKQGDFSEAAVCFHNAKEHFERVYNYSKRKMAQQMQKMAMLYYAKTLYQMRIFNPTEHYQQTALDIIDDMIKQKYKDRDIFNLKGLIMLKQKKYNEAEQAFTASLEIDKTQEIACTIFLYIKNLQEQDLEKKRGFCRIALKNPLALINNLDYITVELYLIIVDMAMEIEDYNLALSVLQVALNPPVEWVVHKAEYKLILETAKTTYESIAKTNNEKFIITNLLNPKETKEINKTDLSKQIKLFETSISAMTNILAQTKVFNI